MGEVLFHGFVLLVSIVFLAVHGASFFFSDNKPVAVLILPSSRIRYQMMWYRYPVHTVSVAARSRLAYFFASSHQLPACLPSFRSSSRLAGRVVVSLRRLPI